jgi:hypothetical protein
VRVERTATDPDQVVDATWLGFLSPEDVVVWRDPRELMDRLTAGFAADDEAAFVAANRLALEAFRAGEATAATAVCRAEIDYAASAIGRDFRPRTALLGMQPVINLIRLNGYTADLSLARRGLAGLERLADGAPLRLFGLDLTGEVLASMGGAAPALRGLARNNCLVETAKILWRRGRRDEMLHECRRLRRKWPDTSATGPYHAVEAEWLTDAGDQLTEPVATAGVTRRIRGVHQVSQGRGDDPVERARLLYRNRARAYHGQPSARDLAVLGDALLRLGDGVRGRRCLAEAHDLAVRADPVLANRIRSRWLGHGPRAGPVPPVAIADRLSRADLDRATALATARFRC